MERIAHYRNNCVLVAIKEVSGRDDVDILAAVRKHGYKNNHGMWKHDYDKALTDLGMELGSTIQAYDLRKVCGADQFKPITLRTVLSYLKRKTGVWMVRVRGHVFTIREGRLVDTNIRKAALGRRIVDITEVLNPYRPVISGLVTYARSINPKRFGSSSYSRFHEMMNYVRTHGPVKKEVLFEKTSYHSGDYRFDLERGNIKLV
jgi:hypothetical protein